MNLTKDVIIAMEMNKIKERLDRLEGKKDDRIIFEDQLALNREVDEQIQSLCKNNVSDVLDNIPFENIKDYYQVDIKELIEKEVDRTIKELISKFK